MKCADPACPLSTLGELDTCQDHYEKLIATHEARRKAALIVVHEQDVIIHKMKTILLNAQLGRRVTPLPIRCGCGYQPTSYLDLNAHIEARGSTDTSGKWIACNDPRYVKEGTKFSTTGQTRPKPSSDAPGVRRDGKAVGSQFTAKKKTLADLGKITVS